MTRPEERFSAEVIRVWLAACDLVDADNDLHTAVLEGLNCGPHMAAHGAAYTRLRLATIDLRATLTSILSTYRVSDAE